MVTESWRPKKWNPAQADVLEGSSDSQVRKAESRDIRPIAELIETRRTEYQQYHPRFWREATDARGKFPPTLESLLQNESAIVLVNVQGGKVNGTIIGILQRAPAAYDPGGLTCIVDDFVVAAPTLWNSVGMALLYALTREARQRGAVQVAITCARKDMRKRSMLVAHKYDLTSEWFVRDVGPGA